MKRLQVLVLCACFMHGGLYATLSADDDEYVSLRKVIGQGRYEEALSTCIKLIQKHPDSLQFYETLPEVAQYSGNYDRALAFLEERIEDGTGLPFVYYSLGTAYYSKRDYKSAVICFNSAIESGNATPECYRGLEYAYEKLEGLDAATRFFNLLCHRDPENANNWYGLALAYWSRQDYDRVKSCLDEALSRRPNERRFIQARVAANALNKDPTPVWPFLNRLVREAGESHDFGGQQFLKSFLVIGLVNQSRYQSALQIINEIMCDSRTYGYLRWLGWGYSRMADVRFIMGEYQPSILYAREAASAAQRISDEGLILASLSRLFEAYSEIGDHFNALETAYQELSINQNAELSAEHIKPLVDIACALHDVCSDELALEFAVEALGKCETLKPDPRLLYRIHMCLGMIYEGLGSFGEAYRHFCVAADLTPKNSFWNRNMALVHGHLGRSLLGLKRYAEGKTQLYKQLNLARIDGYEREECYAESYLGMLFLDQSDLRTSRIMFEDGYARGSKLGQLPAILICARGLSELAEKSRRLEEAALWRARALRTSESMGLWHERLMTLDLADRDLFRDYHEYVRVLCALGKVEEAFEIAERARMLKLAKLINIPQIEKGFEAGDPLLSKLMALRREIIRLHLSLASEKTPIVPANSLLPSLRTITQLNHLELTFQKILDTLRETKGGAPRQTKPEVCSASQVQEYLGKHDAAILEFVVGEAKTTVIVLSSTSIGSVECNISAKALRALLLRSSGIFVDNKQSSMIMNAAIADINFEPLSELFKLLVAPVLPRIGDVKGLIVVTDGVLANFPFEVLVTNGGGKKRTGDRWRPHFLVEENNITYALSASDLLNARVEGRGAEKTMLAIGDALVNPKTGVEDAMHRGQDSVSLPIKYSRVFPGLKRELASIKKIFGRSAEVISQDRATASTLGRIAREYQIIHIASHVEFDNSRPLYSMIAMSPESANGEVSGIRAIEFLGLDLNADLVVLSGCNTGRATSEFGISELTGAIVLSGVPSVVSSLWNVDDEVTAQLMEAFYQNLHSGRSKGEALRLAKLSMIKSGRSDPFYWAAFVLFGNEGYLPLDERAYQADDGRLTFELLLLLLLSLGLISAAAIYLRRSRNQRVKLAARHTYLNSAFKGKRELQ